MNGSFSPISFKVLRPAIKNLLIINGLFFLATISFAYIYLIDPYDILGLHLIGSEKFHLYQFITYMFMHGGFTHFFINMFALWMFGNVLENYWGSKRFLIYYFVTGIGAVIIYKLWLYYDLKPVLDVIDAQLAHPSVASFSEFLKSSSFKIVSQDMQNNYNEFALKYNTAQPEQVVNLIRDFFVQYRIDYMNAPVFEGVYGAVFGLLLAFGMLFPYSRIYVFTPTLLILVLYFFNVPDFFKVNVLGLLIHILFIVSILYSTNSNSNIKRYLTFPVKAIYFIIFYSVIELYCGTYDLYSFNFYHFARLGGMLFGFILIKIWGKKKYFDNP